MTLRPHVMIATPCFGGLVTQSYMQCVIALMQAAPLSGFDVSLAMLGNDALITRARNTLVAQFLDVPQATHLMFIDADIAFEHDHVGRLLAAGKDVIGGMYPLKVIDWSVHAMKRVSGGEPLETAPYLYVGKPAEGAEARREGPFITATYVGTGFVLIARAAIERMIAAYPETRYAEIQAHPIPKRTGQDHYALFDCLIEPETGIYLSEDFAFCRRWRAIGGEVWLDTQGKLTHIGPVNFPGNPAVRFPAG
ncbi:hypothetical protein [Zavarzinia sp. CC-PAN008]|uniref:hypothetical protein n=1 Tax=Zavarzinia sp. CC-PAN008 TaxID=3243332 RepID=UPI003F74252E